MYSSQTLSYCMVCAHLLQQEHKILLYWTFMLYGYGMANSGPDVLDYSHGIALTSLSWVWFCTQLSKLKPSIAFHESESKYCSLKIQIPLFGDLDPESTSSISHKSKTDNRSSMIRPPNKYFSRFRFEFDFWTIRSPLVFCSAHGLNCLNFH